jgi:tRNA-uridine 2-sulfurtransferase
MTSKRVVVGLSGGVDSSVAAYLLLQQGYDVIGIFMRNWHDESVVINQECPWIDDSNDAMLVANQLGIPFQVLDLSKAYKERIVEYMFQEYEAGFTPNPDILCNREIKFDVFLKAAEQLGADFVATGHYCQKTESVENGASVFHLLAGADGNKDQSYFLCQTNQLQLSKALFPIGHLQKSEVRKIAHDIGLPTATKKDSQGLCFVGKVKLPVFLQQQLAPKEGNIVEISPEEFSRHCFDLAKEIDGSMDLDWEHLSREIDWSTMKGKWVGKHQGAHYYTVGQRKGLKLGGFKEPLFILAVNTESNTVYVGAGENHPGLYRSVIFIPHEEQSWIQSKEFFFQQGTRYDFSVRIRYRQILERATMISGEEGIYLVFEHPQRAVARGQFAAWYKADELIGSGRMIR